MKNQPPCGLLPLTLAVLVPDRGRLSLFIGSANQRLHYHATVAQPSQLLDLLDTLPGSTVPALAGNHGADQVSYVVLPSRDLLVVPDVWLSHIPKRDTARRARTAARLVAAHLLDPIQMRISPSADDDIPF